MNQNRLLVKPALFSLLFSFAILVFAQTGQNEYLEAKRQFGLGNYTEARQSFEGLVSDKMFGEYASFYYALSSSKLGEYKTAEDMFRQIQIKFPSWDQQEEVSYWITRSLFQQKNYWKAFQEVEKLSEVTKIGLIDEFIGELSLNALDSAYALNPNNKYIGRFYADVIKKQPYEKQDKFLLKELAEKFDLEIISNEILPNIKKDEYGVAAVLPFMFDSLGVPRTVIRNAIIFDLYQGMNLAQKELDKEGIKINLFPYDTKKKAAVVRGIVSSGKLDGADVIVGPLFSGPSRIISDFSKENKVTMINPLSSNGDIIKQNPYSYLFKPSYQTQGREAAKYAAKTFTDNKKVFIFYETKRDSLVAGEYLKTIEMDSFFVVRFEQLNNEDAQQIQKDFTEQYEVRLDTMYSQLELDSIADIPGRIVRTRSLRNERTGRIVKDDEGEDVIETYEVKFSVKLDSIGHIFAATSSNLLANNLISMIEVRTDSIGLIGYENWLDFSLVSYDQLERLQINFLSPSFFNTESNIYRKVEESFIEKLGTQPSEYHLYGYELMMQLGRSLNMNGKYPQRGWSNGMLQKGEVMDGMKFGIFQDNQVVPITTLRNLELINQNISASDED